MHPAHRLKPGWYIQFEPVQYEEEEEDV